MHAAFPANCRRHSSFLHPAVSDECLMFSIECNVSGKRTCDPLACGLMPAESETAYQPIEAITFARMHLFHRHSIGMGRDQGCKLSSAVH